MTHSRKALVLLITVVASATSAVAIMRTNPLFDRYGPISLKAEKERLKNYAHQLRNSPDSRGVLIVYAGVPWDEAAARARVRRAYSYLVKNERVDAKRLQWRYDGVCKQASVLLYHLYPDQSDPAPDPTCKR